MGGKDIQDTHSIRPSSTRMNIQSLAAFATVKKRVLAFYIPTLVTKRNNDLIIQWRILMMTPE